MNQLISFFLPLACIVSNISQVPALFGNGLVSGLYTLLWVSLAGIVAIKKPLFKISWIIWPLLFDVFCVLMHFVNGRGYTDSNLFRPVNLCAFVLVVGAMAGQFLSDDTYRKTNSAFVLSTFVVAVYIYLNYFRGANWAGSGVYLYTSKNSAGQILLVAAVIMWIEMYDIHKMLATIGILFMVALIFMMKSRATLVSLIIVVLYLAFIHNHRFSKKIGYLLLGVIAVMIVLSNQQLYHVVVENVLLRNKDINDITGVLSDRNLQLQSFIIRFPQYAAIGTGGSYLESFPLAVLLSYGVIGSIPVLVFSIMPMIISLRDVHHPVLGKKATIVMCLNIMMWVNGVFEEQSPFGPGVKCYFLWLMLGLYIGSKIVSERYAEYD